LYLLIVALEKTCMNLNMAGTGTIAIGTHGAAIKKPCVFKH
jgi:hypothetical protein